ncbi:MAG: hypothetical protein GWP17_02470, partial [Aquificales bacterium]|nr:hypothetical protein [Aquificales bacterium]
WSQSAPTELGLRINPDVTTVAPRTNKQTTDNDGYYGWDVPEGCWYVTVQAAGYHPLTSPVVGVPTAVTDLNLKLTPLHSSIYLPTILKNYTPPPPSLPSCTLAAPASASPAGVDLLITSIRLSPESPITGETVAVNVTIKNQGQTSVPADNNFFLDFYVNPDPEPPAAYQYGDHLWGVQGEQLAAGSSKTFSTSYVFDSAGDMRLWAQVDTDHAVDEADKANNIYGCILVVR